MDARNLRGIIEAILFVAGEPVPVEDLAHSLDLTVGELEEALTALRDEYDVEMRGVRLCRFGESVQLTTRADYAPYIERLLQPIQKQSLSQAAMETHSIVAYRQPVTKTEIEAVRGVKCDYSVSSLVNKGLIVEVGRRESLGRPILYGTTEKFLQHFGLERLEDLPPMQMPALDQRIEEVQAQEDAAPGA